MRPLVQCAVAVLVSIVIPQESQSVDPVDEPRDPSWRLEIELSKNTYLLREPIWVDVYLTNVSSDTLRFFGMFPPGQSSFHIELRDERGEKMPYTGPTYHLAVGTNKGLLMDSQERFYDCYNLLELFSTYKSILRTYFGLLPVGKYMLLARYGGTYSQELEFEIIEPAGSEAEPYQLFDDALAVIRRDGFDSAKAWFRQLIERFPSSVYAVIASREVLTPLERVQRYPNSGFSQYYLRGLIWKMPKEQQQTLLHEVIAETPESRTTRFARQMLRVLEKEPSESK